MKHNSKKNFTPRFLTEAQSMERLKKNRPDLYQALKKPSPKACLGANIQTFRRDLGLSQKELAEKAGVGFRTLQRIEEAQPTSNPTIDVIVGVAQALGVQLQNLFKTVDLTKLPL